MDKKAFFNTELPALPASKIIDHEYMEGRFIDIYETIHGGIGRVIYEREKFYFQKILSEDNKFSDCTKLSIFSSFLDLASQGLSLSGGSKPQCYLLWRNIKVGSGQYEKRAYLQRSGYGELVIRIRANQVSYTDNPEALYEGESFEQTNTPNGISINHKITYPRPGKDKMLMIYVRIVRPDGSITYGTLDMPGIERLKEYSAKKNNGNANALYDKLDLGFLFSKLYLHCFSSFPKVKLSNFSKATNEKETPEELGLPENFVNELPAPESTQSEPEGVTIKDKNLDMF